MANNFVTKIDMTKERAANAETFGKPSAPMSSACIKLSNSVFSPLANPFQSRVASEGEILHLTTQQEPRTAHAASSTSDMDEAILNYRMGNAEFLFEELNNNNAPNYCNMGNTENNNTSVSSASSYTNLWNNATANPAGGQKEDREVDAFDFFIKSVTTSNHYMSSLNAEELSLFKALHPSFIYNFMLEVTRARNGMRPRRATPTQCAFCKNNGENEECYSSHILKDFHGRVMCPVLRAFRCPRCGATGGRAHTIKYCPVNNEAEHSSRRRMMSPAASIFLGQPLQGNVSQSHQSVSLQVALGRQHNMQNMQNDMRGMQSCPPTPTTPYSNGASRMFHNTSTWSNFARQ